MRPVSDFWPQEGWDNTSMLFKSLSLWQFVTAAKANQHNRALKSGWRERTHLMCIQINWRSCFNADSASVGLGQGLKILHFYKLTGPTNASDLIPTLINKRLEGTKKICVIFYSSWSLLISIIPHSVIPTTLWHRNYCPHGTHKEATAESERWIHLSKQNHRDGVGLAPRCPDSRACVSANEQWFSPLAAY